MSKHRRAPSRPPALRPAREVLVWTCFGCLLVPVALLWSGAGWAVSFGVAGLIALLALGCGLALRLSGISLSEAERPSSAQPGPDDRPDAP